MTTDPISDDALAELAEVEPCFNELAQQLARQLLAARQGEHRLRALIGRLLECKGYHKWARAEFQTITKCHADCPVCEAQALTGEAPDE